MANSTDNTLRSEALLGLSLIGSQASAAAPLLVTTLHHETNTSRFLMASEALGKVDPAAAVEALSDVVHKDPDAGRRSWALTALLKLPPDSSGAVPVLSELLHNREEDVRLRVQAAEVLWHFHQPPEPLVEVLCAVANDDKSPAGVQALSVLGELGPAGKLALPTLLQLLQKRSLAATGQKWGPVHRASVIRAVGKLGPEAGPSVPALIAILKSNASPLYREVAQALGQIGPPAKTAVPVLLKALFDKRTSGYAGLTALAATPQTLVTIPPLVPLLEGRRSPWDLLTIATMREAVQRIDPQAAAQAGLH
jgi:HEAT repeat protein